jgi:hypothetical protein
MRFLDRICGKRNGFPLLLLGESAIVKFLCEFFVFV